MEHKRIIGTLLTGMIGIGILVVVVLQTEKESNAMIQVNKSVLKSSLAGQWYPGDAQSLKQQLDKMFEQTSGDSDPDAMALILPHAGYQYSGPCAAQALARLGKTYKRVVVIGPSHQVSLPEALSVPQVTHYQTPLGEVALDQPFIQALLEHPQFRSLPAAHQTEHSVQIELPLLQHRLGDFTYVPIVAGQLSLDTIEAVAAILKGMMDDDTLLVASSDFTHYGRQFNYVPFEEDVQAELKKLDMGAYAHIKARDARGFIKYQAETGATICGRVPIAIVLSMLSESVQVDAVDYTTSGEITGDFQHSVSYLSVLFSGGWGTEETVASQPLEASLSEQDKATLLKLARKTIAYYLEKNTKPTPEDLDISVGAALHTSRAAFVTLTKNHALRGCIGDILPRQALYASVIANAVNAAVNDYRFGAVSPDELDSLHIEISALTVPAPVDSYRDIRIGIDGVILEKGGHRAVFLPQVAPEQGWDVEETLTYLAQKAGLAPDGWKEGARFLCFQAEVFGEPE